MQSQTLVFTHFSQQDKGVYSAFRCVLYYSQKVNQDKLYCISAVVNEEIHFRLLPSHFSEDCIVSFFFVGGVDISSSAS